MSGHIVKFFGVHKVRIHDLPRFYNVCNPIDGGFFEFEGIAVYAVVKAVDDYGVINPIFFEWLCTDL